MFYNSCCLFGNCWSKIPLNLAIGTMEFETNLNFAFFVKSFGFDLLSKLSWEFALRNAFKGFWLTAQTLLASRHSTFPDISVTDKMYTYKVYRIESVSKTIITRKSQHHLNITNNYYKYLGNLGDFYYKYLGDFFRWLLFGKCFCRNVM